VLGLVVVSAGVVAYAAMRKRLSTTILTGPLLFLGLGLVLSSKVLGVVDLDLDATAAQVILKATLVIILFTEASELDARKLRSEAVLDVRLLAFAMPLAIIVGAVVAAAVFGAFNVWEAAVLAALLAPTDAALGQPVVTNPRVPGPVRRSLVVEAGLNDGLAVPFAFAFAAAGEILADETTVADGLVFLAQQVGLGTLVGIAVGFLGGWLLVWTTSRDWGTNASIQLAFVALAGVAFAAAEGIGGNGFISAWVAGLSYAIATDRSLHCDSFAARSGDLLTLLSFFMFGVAILPTTLSRVQPEWVLYALASLVAIRPIAVGASLVGSGLRLPTVAYLGWFGPRGIASLILALLVAKQFALDNVALVLDIVTITVALSVVLHGVSAWPGSQAYADWIKSNGMGPLERYATDDTTSQAG